jgi:hypothetical protein
MAVTDTNNFHHVAVTKSGSNVQSSIIDGKPETAAPYDPGFCVLTAQPLLALAGWTMVAGFLGAIDEVSVYNRSAFDSRGPGDLQCWW